MEKGLLFTMSFIVLPCLEELVVSVAGGGEPSFLGGVGEGKDPGRPVIEGGVAGVVDLVSGVGSRAAVEGDSGVGGIHRAQWALNLAIKSRGTWISSQIKITIESAGVFRRPSNSKTNWGRRISDVAVMIELIRRQAAA